MAGILLEKHKPSTREIVFIVKLSMTGVKILEMVTALFINISNNEEKAEVVHQLTSTR